MAHGRCSRNRRYRDIPRQPILIGQFTVRVSGGSGWSRVEVSDTGTGQWNPLGDSPDDAQREHGRGLMIVAKLADKLGHDVTPEGQTLWAEIHWPAQEEDH